MRVPSPSTGSFLYRGPGVRRGLGLLWTFSLFVKMTFAHETLVFTPPIGVSLLMRRLVAVPCLLLHHWKRKSTTWFYSLTIYILWRHPVRTNNYTQCCIIFVIATRGTVVVSSSLVVLTVVIWQCVSNTKYDSLHNVHELFINFNEC